MPRLTLVVGLGGTGKDIVYDIRRRVVSRYGAVENVPYIKYLVVDTDGGQVVSMAGQGQTEEVEDDITLTTHEYIHAVVSAADIASIRNSCNQNLLHGQYPYLSGWLTANDLRLPQISTGAGMIRKLGRLALYMNWTAVQQTITSWLQQLRSPDTLQAAGFAGQANPPIDVYVVNSLMGGTGSGMFLDVAYMIRRVRPPATTVTGMFILPEEHLGKGEWDYRAIAYAALWELNHLNDPETVYRAEWPDGTKAQEADAPFDFLYLLTCGNGQTRLNAHQLKQMVGQAIFMRATSDFSTIIETFHANFGPQMNIPDQYHNNRFYATFGFSTIEVPVETIINSCAYRLLGEVWDRIAGPVIQTQQTQQPGQVASGPMFSDPEIEQKLRQQRLDLPGLEERLLEHEVATPDGRVQRISVHHEIYGRMRNALNQLVRELDNPFCSMARVEAIIKSLRQNLDLMMEQGSGPGTQSFYAIAQQNAQDANNWALAALNGLVGAEFQLSDRRIRGAIALLEAVRDHWQKLLANVDAIRNQWQNELQDAAARLRRIYGTSIRAVARDAVMFAHRGFALEKELAEKLFPAMLHYYRLLLRQKVIAPFLPAVLTALTNAAEQYLTRLRQLEQFVVEEAERCRDRAEREVAHLQPINGEVLFVHDQTNLQLADDIDLNYSAVLKPNPGIVDSVVQQLINVAGCRVQTQMGIVVDLLKLLEYRQKPIELRRLRTQARQIAAYYFSGIRNLDALEKFYAKYGVSQELRTAMELLLGRATPFLVVQRNLPGFQLGNNQEMFGVAFLGGVNPATSSGQQFLNDVKQHIPPGRWLSCSRRWH